jgi:D-alanine---D-serine ligase
MFQNVTNDTWLKITKTVICWLFLAKDFMLGEKQIVNRMSSSPSCMENMVRMAAFKDCLKLMNLPYVGCQVAASALYE